MARWLVTASFLLPLSTLSSAALAADDECPPGSWFCDEVTVPQAEEAEDADEEVAPPPRRRSGDDELATSPDDAPEAKTPPKKHKKHKNKKKKKKVHVEAETDASAETRSATKTVEVDAEGGDTVVIVKHKKAEAEPRERNSGRKKKKPQRRWRERFGLNLRLDGATFMNHSDDLVGMGGAGLSFRWRPSPYFAFDVGTDLIGGTDYNDDQRVEISGALSGIVYFNPQHRVQVYGIGGINLAHAEVDQSQSFFCDFCDSTNTEGRNYFGGHGGLGVEFRIARHFGMFVDALALVRKRIDSDVPEYRNPNTGEGTNVSAAGLFRTGVNFWW